MEVVFMVRMSGINKATPTPASFRIFWVGLLLIVGMVGVFQVGMAQDSPAQSQAVESQAPAQSQNPEPTTEVIQPEAGSVLSLSDAVSLSLENNRELIATRFDSKASVSARNETLSSYLPQIFFNSSTTKTESDRYKFSIDPSSPFAGLFDFSSLGMSGTNYVNKFQLNQLIFDHSVIGRIKQSNLQIEASNWQEKGQEQVAVFSTVAAYLDVLRAQELLNVQKQRLALADKQLNTAKTNFEVGLRIRTDVLRAELTRSSALRDVVSAEIALRNTQVQLNKVMGEPIDRYYQFVGGPLVNYNPTMESVEAAKNYEKLFTIAEENHPSIKVASYLLDQTEESVNIARGEFLPRVAAGASWGFNESGDLSFDDEEWTLSLQVEVPIFEGGRKIAKMSRTRSQFDAEKSRYDDTIRSIKTLVEQSALALQEEQRNLEIAVEAEVVAKENHERFLNLYEEGLADSLDVTQALTELVEAQTNVVSTRYGYLRVYAQLLSALGLIPTEESPYGETEWLATLK